MFRIGIPPDVSMRILGTLFCILLLKGVDGQQTAKFTSHPESQVITLGEDITLRCSLLPHQPVTWIFNGFPLAIADHSVKSDALNGWHELVIHKAAAGYDGEYSCQTESTPFIQSQSATVTILVPPTEIKLVPFNPTTIVQENVEASLTCQVNNGKPAPTVQWIKDGSLVENGVDTRILSSDSHKIENVTSTLKWIPDRRENEKKVYCQAKHEALRTKPMMTETILLVEYAPSVKIVSVPAVVKEGESVTLQCLADANPFIDLKFRWTKNGRTVPNVFGGSLFIDKAERNEHPVLYSCEATNKIGTSSADFTLDVHYGPQFYSTPEIVAGDLNNDLFLTCNVDSNPRPEISWVSESSPNKVIGTESAVRIPLKKSEDFGTYTCIANVPGFDEARKAIRVLQKGKPFIAAEAPTYAVPGDVQSQIQCVAIGLPVVQNLRWSDPYGNEVLKENRGRYEILEKALNDRFISILTIKDVKKEDFGLWTCSASNAYGNDTRPMPLKETDRTLPVIIGGACGGVILLVLIVVTAILVIRCRSHKRLKQASDTSGSTTTSDDLGLPPQAMSGHSEPYHTSNETLSNTKHNSWTGSNVHQNMLQTGAFTIDGDYLSRKDMENYYRYTDYDEYNPHSSMAVGVPTMYTPTMSIIDHHGAEDGRDPSPYQASGLPRMEPLYARHPAVMLDATLSNRLATNV